MAHSPHACQHLLSGEGQGQTVTTLQIKGTMVEQLAWPLL